jgi:hypothetical protein
MSLSITDVNLCVHYSSVWEYGVLLLEKYTLF